MAYVALTTVTTGTPIATSWGNQVKDNFAAGVPDIFTTKGDLAAATAADAAARVAVGTNYQILESLSTATAGIAWGGGVYCAAAKSAAQSINDNTLTKVAVATAVSDPYSMLDAVNNRLTIPVGFPTRYYIVVASGYFAGHATADANRQIEITTAAGTIARNSAPQPSGTLTVGLCVTTPPYALAAGNYVEVYVQQNSGGSLNWTDTRFGLFMIR